MSSFILISILAVFLILSGFFSLSETAVLSSNRYRIRHLASQGNRKAKKLSSWLETPQKLLATILLGNNFANIGAAVVPIEFCMKIFYPIASLSITFSGLFYRSVRENQQSLAASISDVELKSVINSYTQDRRKMLERVLEFSERQVRDVMVSRMETTSLAISTPLEEVLRVVESTRFTRYPVYHGSMDNVLGILHGKDLMPYLHQPKTFRISHLLRKPIFIPDTAPLNKAIRVLQGARTHLGIVVDEHGGVEGIVTLEDLVEQIVGEIQDEHDIKVDEIIPEQPGSYLIDASISVRDLNERLDLAVPQDSHYVTLAGFVLMKTGRLPTEGDEIDFKGDRYQVDQMIGRRIMRIRLRKEPNGDARDTTGLDVKEEA